jgi:predicted  nucleic acid-binding Zn-ribbon protein
MQANLQRLVELQGVDVRLEEQRRKLASFPGRIAEIEAKLGAARAKLNAAREALANGSRERKKFELDVEQWRERARKYRDQSHEVKTNEAFKALQHEIQHAENEMTQAEDRLLERMVSGEEYDRQVKADEGELKQAEGVAATERSAVEEERADTEKNLAAIETERKGVLEGIPENLLAEYQRIGRRHHGIALADVRNEACGACGVRIRPHVYQELRRPGNEQLFTCETCNRILYAPEPTAPSLAAAQPDSESSATAVRIRHV